MTSTASLTFYFDFLCPFAYRTTLWIDEVQRQTDITVTWKFFSLEQVNADPASGWKLWEQPDDYAGYPGRSPEYRALLAFWAAAAARRQGPAAFDTFRRALYHARHATTPKIDLTDRVAIRAVAAQAELDLAAFDRDFADRSLLDDLRDNHEEARERYQTFGVPTLAFDGENAIYLKLMELPPAAEALTLYHELAHSFTTRRWLAEVKRPNP
jgi:predicted DsbA family dithiol-disulfide isomerase